MESFSGNRGCLICRRATLNISSVDSQNLVSNAILLQDFLNCFQINVLDSEVNDLSTSCQFCPTCQQFLAEWSSTQTQMTQLTRRAAQLKATISALLLSAPQIQEQNHDEDVTQIINNRIESSREVELPLLLQQTVDDIRNELRKEYSVQVMLDKVPLPSVHNLDPLSTEPWGQWPSGNEHSGAEYLQTEGQINNEETAEQIFEVGIKVEEEAYCENSNSQASVDFKETNAKARNNKTNACPKSKKKQYPKHPTIPIGPNRFKFKGMSFRRNEEDQTYTCDACGFKSGPIMSSIRTHIVNHLIKKDFTGKREKQPAAIPDGPNRFKYNGYDIRFKDEDQCYYCGTCNLKGHISLHSILAHIRHLHYTAEDKIKFTAIRTSDTEWLYGGKYQIIKLEEKKFECVSCGFEKSDLHKMVAHIRGKHVDMEGSEKVVPLPETDIPSANDSSHLEDSVGATSDKDQLPPVLKLEPFPVDYDKVDEAWDHWECEANIQLPVVPKIEPLSGGDNNDDEHVDDWEFGAEDCDEEYLPSEDELEDEETSEIILGMEIQPEEEANCDDSNSQGSVASKEMEVRDGSSKPKRRSKINKTLHPKKAIIIPDGPNRFKYKGLSFQRNEEDQTYTCGTCGFKSGPELKSIRGHMVFHFKEKWKRVKKSVVIPDGPNRFKYNGYGLTLNDEDQHYYCGTCNFRGHTSLLSTLSHIREMHYTTEDKIKFTALKINNTEWLYRGKYKITKTDEKFRCESCGTEKSTLYELVMHVRTHHVDLEDPDGTVPLPEQDISSFIDTTHFLANHGECLSVPYTFNPADRKYTCGLCESQLSSRKSLGKHVRRKHTVSTKKFPCEICGAELASQEGRPMHMKRHQTSPMDCPICNKEFDCERSYKSHMKLHELGKPAKKYECEHCGKKVSALKYYKEHLRIHTGEKPYECQICGEKFRTASVLSVHRRSAHAIQPHDNRLAKVSKAQEALPSEENI